LLAILFSDNINDIIMLVMAMMIMTEGDLGKGCRGCTSPPEKNPGSAPE